mgnify:CR=1 FL=1
MKYNKNDKRRWEIIDDCFENNRYEKDSYFGGVRHFQNLSIDKLETLLKEGFADPEENQNYSPTIKEFLEFANRYKDFAEITFNGYIVSPVRSDYRVSVDAITIVPNNINNNERTMLAIAAMNFGKEADETDFNDDSFYLWWD